MNDTRKLTLDDLPAALALSTVAGWNQTPTHWRRLLTLWPENCLAGCVDGKVMATATLVTYSKKIGWVGMVLVDPVCRGKGLGTTMLQAILKHGDDLGLEVMGLDATDMGRPLYLKNGFVDGPGIDRWMLQNPGNFATSTSIQSSSPATIRAISPQDWPKILQLDAIASGVDRHALLQRLCSDEGSTGLVACSGSQVLGFGLAHAGRVAHAIGPIIAQDENVAANLLDALMHDQSQKFGAMPFFIDVLRGCAMDRIITSRGFVVQRKLTRMFRASQNPSASHAPISYHHLLSGPSVMAVIGFELG